MNIRVFWVVFISIVFGSSVLIGGSVAVAYMFKIHGVFLGVASIVFMVALLVALFAGVAERDER